MLSPKGANLGQRFKAEPINTKLAIFEAKNEEIL